MTLLWALLVTLVYATPASAAFPGANGRIAFSRTGPADLDLYARSADGSTETRLTSDAVVEMRSDYSSDGRTVAYSRWTLGAFDVYSMNGDGSAPINLSNTLAHDFDPSWSPNGGKVAFVSDRSGNNDVWVMNADGSSPVNLTAASGNDDIDPSWSPDGTKIVYAHYQASHFDIWVMNADGSGQTKLSNSGPSDDLVEPSWSPDGAKVAYTLRNRGSYDIVVMNANGTGATSLTGAFASNDEQAAWSPDGTKIAFHSNRSGNGDVWVMNQNGSSPVNYTAGSAVDDAYPNWGPASAPPTVPTVTATSPASPANDNTPLVQGSTVTGATVSVFSDAACTTPPLASGPAATFASPGLMVSVPDDSTTTFYAKATDGYGAASACSSAGFTYVEDSTPPATPATPDMAASSDSGASSADNLTNDDTPTFSGSAEPGSTVRLRVDGTVKATGVATGGPFTLTSSSLADGAHVVTVVATDAAGNASPPSSSLAVQIDRTPPAAPAITQAPVESSSVGTPTWSFSGEAGASFECRLSSSGEPVFVLASCSSPHAYDLTGRPQGSYLFELRQTDSAGNAGPLTGDAFVYATSSEAPTPGAGGTNPTPESLNPAAPGGVPVTKARAMVFNRGKVAVPIECPAEGGLSCVGAVSLYALLPAAKGDRAHASRRGRRMVRASRRGRRLAIGRQSFSLRPGSKARVRVRISRRGRRLFSNGRTVKAELRIDSRNQAGGTKRTTRKVTLRRGRSRSARR